MNALFVALALTAVQAATSADIDRSAKALDARRSKLHHVFRSLEDLAAEGGGVDAYLDHGKVAYLDYELGGERQNEKGRVYLVDEKPTLAIVRVELYDKPIPMEKHTKVTSTSYYFVNDALLVAKRGKEAVEPEASDLKALRSTITDCVKRAHASSPREE